MKWIIRLINDHQRNHGRLRERLSGQSYKLKPGLIQKWFNSTIS